MNQRESILVVDDESDSLMLLTNILAAEGYEVRSANSGQLALASAASRVPDLVILDIRMPGMDGFEVCRRLKANEKMRDVPVIFLSSADGVDDRVAGLALGAVDYIAKPFPREELVARVRTHLELGRLRTRLESHVMERTTELQSVIERLHESEGRFREIADTAPILIWISTPDKLCSFFNKGWLNFTGRSMGQELGNGWLEGVHPDDVGPCFQNYSTCFDERQSFRIEYRLRRADGEYRWVLDRGAPRFTASGEFTGYIGSAVDITDLKRAREEALTREKLESLAVLTRGIAHDFNNLMGNILAEAEVAETHLTEGASPQDEIQQIKTAAMRASEVVGELMIYSGEEKTSFELVNLSTLVEEMLELLRISISKHVVMHVDLDRHLPPVNGNATQIRQIVMNLIINASQAIGEEAGEIVVRTSPDSSGERVRLEVSDTGCGISDVEKEKIFDAFFTSKPGGHGLGLAVVQGIVTSHGGTINVDSTPGKGSTFEVILPRAEELPAAAPPGFAQTEPDTAACGTVLLVEDEGTLQFATSKLLRKKGFKVLPANDGWAALELFKEHANDIGVVLLDLTLPGIPGREVLRELRAIKPDVKVVLTSAYDQSAAGAPPAGERDLAFLRKPYAVADLIRELQAACS
jgi:PAS domain S-box-containing protein